MRFVVGQMSCKACGPAALSSMNRTQVALGAIGVSAHGSTLLQTSPHAKREETVLDGVISLRSFVRVAAGEAGERILNHETQKMARLDLNPWRAL
nr:hypothetical protein CFP56_21953 [Quercus suber]